MAKGQNPTRESRERNCARESYIANPTNMKNLPRESYIQIKQANNPWERMPPRRRLRMPPRRQGESKKECDMLDKVIEMLMRPDTTPRHVQGTRRPPYLKQARLNCEDAGKIETAQVQKDRNQRIVVSNSDFTPTNKGLHTAIARMTSDLIEKQVELSSQTQSTLAQLLTEIKCLTKEIKTNQEVNTSNGLKREVAPDVSLHDSDFAVFSKYAEH